jgi:hypothetical protein
MKQLAVSRSCIVAAALVTGACGGGGGQNPAPTPTPTATPSPTPTSTPTPAPPPFGLASVGQSLYGVTVCQSGNFVRDGAQRITGVTAFDSSTPLLRHFMLDYLAADTFRVSVNDTSGPTFFPQDKETPPLSEYEYFRRPPQEELELYRPGSSRVLKISTIGRYSGSSLCFFAAGGNTPYTGNPAPTGIIIYQGIADGIAVVKGVTYRLLGSPVEASLTYEASGGVFVHLKLAGRQPAFENPSSSPPIDLVDVQSNRIRIDSNGEGYVDFAGTYIGNARFKVSDSDPKPGSVTFAFYLKNAAGDQIIGSAAVEKP